VAASCARQNTVEESTNPHTSSPTTSQSDPRHTGTAWPATSNRRHAPAAWLHKWKAARRCL